MVFYLPSNMSLSLDAKEIALITSKSPDLTTFNSYVTLRVLDAGGKASDAGDISIMQTAAGQQYRRHCIRFTSNKKNRHRQIQEFAERLSDWCERGQHQNLLTIVGLDATSPDGPLIFSASSGHPTIMEHIANSPGVDRLAALCEIANAVKFLHTAPGYSGSPFVHGNIRGDNILVHPDGSCYLGEFGLTYGDPVSSDPNAPSVPVGCRWFAPERLHPQAFAMHSDHHGSYGDGRLRPSSDIYALASTALEIFTGERPYYQYEQDAFVLADALRGQPPQPRDAAQAAAAGMSKDIQLLLQQMWRYIPEQRCSASTVCKVLKDPSRIRQTRSTRLAPVFAATAAAAARRRYM